MIFPKTHALYENLNTSFTNVGELLLDLQTNSFTGYLEVIFQEYEGILFLINGNIVNAIEEAQGKRKTGQEAMINVTAKSKSRNGTISVYSLGSEMVNMVSGVVESEVVHKDLSTEYSSLDKLITKLQDEGHSGYIEINFEGDRGSGIIFFQAGEPIESILNARGELISGSEILPRILKITSTFDASFNVYRTAAGETFAENPEIVTGYDLSELLVVWGEIIGTVEGVFDGSINGMSFLDVFKDTQIEMADEYPFLNPFDNLFDYADGQVTFHGESVTNLNRGLVECLGSAVNNCAVESKEKNMSSIIREELAPVMEKKSKIIELFNLNVSLSDLLA